MTTAHALRAKRARELQAALQEAVRVELSFRSKIAGMVSAWRKPYLKVIRAANRYNAMVEPLDPELIVTSDDLHTPAMLLENLRAGLELEAGELLGQLRKIGPKLQKLPTGPKLRKGKRRERKAEARAAIAKERHRLEGAIVDLEERLANGEVGLRHLLVNRNAMNKTEGKPELSPDEYREITKGWISKARADLKALGR